MAAVLGAEFDSDLVATATDTPLVEVLDALERAEAAGLIHPEPPRPGRFSFVHALFRSARYDAIPTGRRLQLHRRAARALAPRAGDDRVIPELARHACAAAPLGEARLAIDYARRAGDLAARALAFDEAAAHYRRALYVADLLDSPDLSLRGGLMTRLGETLMWAGDPDGRAILEEAAHAARRLGKADMLAAIAWALSPSVFGAAVFDPFVVSIAEEVLAGVGPEPTATRARLLALLGSEYGGSVEHQRGRQVARDEAIEVARRLDDPATLG